MTRTPSLKTIQAYTRKWLVRLGMGHWEVTIRFMNKEESEGEFEECNGFCRWSEQHTHAEIVISREAENWRHTCIHECLHLRLEGHRPLTRTKADIPLEVTINALTRAFLGGK